MFENEKQLEFRDVLKITAYIVVIAIFSVYVVFQARFIITGPQITINTELPTQNTSRVIELSGTTKNITHLWLNDRQIFTDEKGNFKENLVLENGHTITTLKAKDRYGRETELVRSFVYTPASLIKS
ncbi:MAG: hypothetical protein R3B60_00490 [Candidatus Paceibacterota bacterium]